MDRFTDTNPMTVANSAVIRQTKDRVALRYEKDQVQAACGMGRLYVVNDFYTL